MFSKELTIFSFPLLIILFLLFHASVEGSEKMLNTKNISIKDKLQAIIRSSITGDSYISGTDNLPSELLEIVLEYAPILQMKTKSEAVYEYYSHHPQLGEALKDPRDLYWAYTPSTKLTTQLQATETCLALNDTPLRIEQVRQALEKKVEIIHGCYLARINELKSISPSIMRLDENNKSFLEGGDDGIFLMITKDNSWTHWTASLNPQNKYQANLFIPNYQGGDIWENVNEKKGIARCVCRH